MELRDIKASAAAYLGRKTEDLTVNNVDLGLAAMNQVRLLAELNHDFGFTRKLLTLDVSSDTGGSLENATIYGTSDAAPTVKTIVDVGQFDEVGNFIPVEWTTTQESLDRQRMDNPGTIVRYPTDGQAVCGPIGWRRFVFAGDKIYFFPKAQDVTVFTLGIIAYTFTTDWVDDDLKDESTAGAPWKLQGQQYLLWATIVQLNNLFKEFVPRQEGNLPPPQTLADAGLASLIQWDIFKFEQFRRHGR